MQITKMFPVGGNALWTNINTAFSALSLINPFTNYIHELTYCQVSWNKVPANFQHSPQLQYDVKLNLAIYPLTSTNKPNEPGISPSKSGIYGNNYDLYTHSCFRENPRYQLCKTQQGLVNLCHAMQLLSTT